MTRAHAARHDNQTTASGFNRGSQPQIVSEAVSKTSNYVLSSKIKAKFRKPPAPKTKSSDGNRVAFWALAGLAAAGLGIGIWYVVLLAHLQPAGQQIRQILSLIPSDGILTPGERDLLKSDADQIDSNIRIIAFYGASFFVPLVTVIGTMRVAPFKKRKP